MSNIEEVDSVTLLRKDKLMNGVSWSIRFQQALGTWPCINDLGSGAVQVRACLIGLIEEVSTGSEQVGITRKLIRIKWISTFSDS